MEKKEHKYALSARQIGELAGKLGVSEYWIYKILAADKRPGRKLCQALVRTFPTTWPELWYSGSQGEINEAIRAGQGPDVRCWSCPLATRIRELIHEHQSVQAA